VSTGGVRGNETGMGIMSKLLGAGDPATGKRTSGADPRMKGMGRGPTTRATRGKVPPGKTRPSVGRGVPAPSTSSGGLGKLLGSLTGRR